MTRSGSVERKTSETSVSVQVELDGGDVNAATGVPFFDHMLDQLGRHSRIGLRVAAEGDLEIDAHHSLEDCALAFGSALSKALGDRRGIARYGTAYAPLDEALARVVIDCSGRPYLHYQAEMPEPMIGRDFAASLIEEFWRAFVVNAGITAHIDLIRARNAHHAAEAIFKAGAIALHAATRQTDDPTTIPSTKGVLA